MLRSPTLVCLLALSLALASERAAALGLGGMRTQSALNQPFYAEIDLFDVKNDELDTVKVRLASRDDFEQAGAERPHFLTRLNFTPMIGPTGQPIVQITSREPIREPYLDFLVEVLWPQGRLVKEYTVLMDPPVSGAQRAPRVAQAQVTAPVRRPPPQQPSRRAERPDRPPAPPRSEPRPEPGTTARSAPAPVAAKPPSVARQVEGSFPLHYGPVTSGSGLWTIARRMAPPDATVAQTAMALYRNNQNAFVGGNINLLKVGADLIIPTAEELFALDADSAERQFQDALAGRSVTSKPITDIPEQPELRIAVVQTDDGAAADVGENGTDLGAPPEKIGELEEDLLLVRETSESNRQETTELRDRIRELEDQLGDIRRLLELRNEQLAQLQMVALDTGTGTTEANALAVPESDAIETAAEGNSPDSDAALSPPRSAVAMVLDETDRELLPKPSVEISEAVTENRVDRTEQVEDVVDSASLGENSLPGSAESEQQAIAPPPGTTAVEIVAAGASDATEDPEGTSTGLFGFLDPVTDVAPPWALASGLGVIVMGGLGLLAYRRRRQITAIDQDSMALDLDPGLSQGQAESQHADGFAEPAANLASTRESDADMGILPRPKLERVSSLKEALVAGETLSIDLDSLPESELDVGPSQRPVEAEPFEASRTESPVKAASSIHAAPSLMNPSTQETDVLAEADIYILYGRYREAESILLDELKHSPNRVDLRYKLAEAYIGSENRDALTALMGEMESGGEDRNDPARWFTIRQELARMRPPSEADGRSPAGDNRSAPGPLVDEPSMAESESQEITLDVDANDVDPLGGTDFDDSKDAGFGISVHEVESSRADELREQMEDLELDLRDLDMLGDLRADAPSAATQPRADAAFAPMLELPSEAREQSTPSEHRDAPIELGDDLDLDLDALDRLASLDDIDPREESPMEVLNRLDEELLGIDATETPQPDVPLGPELKSVPTLVTEAPLEPELKSVPTPIAEAPPGPELKSAPLPKADAQLNAVTADDLDPNADSLSSEMLSSQWEIDSGFWDEAGTKMDLARAYIEMEDPDAARTILKEVLVEGSEEQQGEASTLLAKLG